MGSTFMTLAYGAALFAEAAVENGGGDAPAPDGGGGMSTMLMMMVAIFALFYFMLIRPQKREQARRQDMLSAIKKNDRVLTAGGIYGVVAGIDRDNDEVTIKVDESANTRLRMTLSSIARVVDNGSPDQSDSK